ncbi:MAG: thiamine pyrophosphate-binding protein, partial [Enterobacteriaceae bacterium]
MSDKITVGEGIARTLEQYGVSALYGIISIHNLPVADAVGRRDKIRFIAARGESGAVGMADAVGRRDKIRFIAARGEAGAVGMADAHSRISGLGVALTSTGAGAGNAAGALMEALNANSPVVHITGQVEKASLDAHNGYIHETVDQLGLLRACSKRAHRVVSAQQAIALLHKAIQEAQTPPYGPVSLEIPIDIQNELIPLSLLTPCVAPYTPPALRGEQLQQVGEQLLAAQRPVLWVGGGAIHCQQAVRKLADAGVAVISSTHGRGILADSHPRSLRAFHNSPEVQQLLQQSDLLLVAGSRLRSNETQSWSLALPQRRIQIDLDPAASNRNYCFDTFVNGDCHDVLSYLAHRVEERTAPCANWDQQLRQAMQQAEINLREQSGPYAGLSDAVQTCLGENGIFVRDVTVS